MTPIVMPQPMTAKASNAKRPSRARSVNAMSATAAPRMEDENGTISSAGIARPQSVQARYSNQFAGGSTKNFNRSPECRSIQAAGFHSLSMEDLRRSEGTVRRVSQPGNQR